jgi:hypothetical protein
VVGILLSCALSLPVSLDSIAEYVQCRNIEKKIEYVIEWKPLVSEYFKQEDIPKALAIIYCESSGRDYVVNDNTNGTRDIGLWQFNDDTWAWLKPKLKIKSNRTNPKVSTAVASWLVYNDGWYHWNSSKHCWGDVDKHG